MQVILYDLLDMTYSQDILEILQQVIKELYL